MMDNYPENYYEQPAYAEPAYKPTFADKVKGLPKLVWIIAAAVLVVALVLVIVLAIVGGGNKPETPIKLKEKIANTEITDPEEYLEYYTKVLNGFASSEAKTILKLYKASPLYTTSLATAKAELQQRQAEMQAAGYNAKNHKVTYQTAGQIPLTPAELMEIQTKLISMGTGFKTDAMKMKIQGSEEYMELMQSTGWDDKQIQKYCNALDKLADELCNAKIDEGYKITAVVTETGSYYQIKNGDMAPSISNNEFTVIKINGRWVDYSDLRSVLWTLCEPDFD
jgi:hypothetical protein